MAAAIAYVWASPSLPKLLAPGGPFQITVEQGTWIVASLKLGQVIGPIPAAWMMDRFELCYLIGIYNVRIIFGLYFSFGRKRSILITSVLLVSGWIMLAFAETFELICVFTFLAGFSISCSYVTLPMYTAEIASPHIRGSLGIIQTVCGKSAILFTFAVGPFISFRLMAWLGTVPIFCFVLIYYWLPESPYHLIAINNKLAAEVSLQKLRCNLDVKEELSQMEISVKKSQENQGTFRELFFNPRNRQKIIVILGLSALLELSGSQIIQVYAQTIFSTLNSGLDPKYSSIIFGVVQFAAAILAFFLVDTIGRRPLLLI